MSCYNGFDVFDYENGKITPHKLSEIDFDNTYVSGGYEPYMILRDYCANGCRYTFTKELDGKTIGDVWDGTGSRCKLVYIPFDVYISDVEAEIASQTADHNRYLDALRREFDVNYEKKREYMDRQMRATPELFDKYQEVIDKLDKKCEDIATEMREWLEDDTDYLRLADTRRILEEMEKYFKAGLTIVILNG